MYLQPTRGFPAAKESYQEHVEQRKTPKLNIALGGESSAPANALHTCRRLKPVDGPLTNGIAYIPHLPTPAHVSTKQTTQVVEVRQPAAKTNPILNFGGGPDKTKLGTPRGPGSLPNAPQNQGGVQPAKIDQGTTLKHLQKHPTREGQHHAAYVPSSFRNEMVQNKTTRYT